MKGSLTERSILIVEDEPLIVMDITQAFEESSHEASRFADLHSRRRAPQRDGSIRATKDPLGTPRWCVCHRSGGHDLTGEPSCNDADRDYHEKTFTRHVHLRKLQLA